MNAIFLVGRQLPSRVTSKVFPECNRMFRNLPTLSNVGLVSGKMLATRLAAASEIVTVKFELPIIIRNRSRVHTNCRNQMNQISLFDPKPLDRLGPFSAYQKKIFSLQHCRTMTSVAINPPTPQTFGQHDHARCCRKLALNRAPRIHDFSGTGNLQFKDLKKCVDYLQLCRYGQIAYADAEL